MALSDLHGPQKAIPQASAAAALYFETNPRLSVAQLQADLATATALGMDAFLAQRAAALAHLTIQRTHPLSDAIMQRTEPTMPPRPPADSLPAFHALPDGAPVILPPGFVPNGCPAEPPKEPGYQAAIERIHLEDHANGRSTILPWRQTRRLFAEAGLPLHSVPNFSSIELASS